MPSGLLSKIEEWFAQSSDGGEFWQCGPADPFSVVGPASAGSGSIYVYSTKTHCAAAAKREYREFDGLGLVCRYGLPCANNVEWISRLLGGSRLIFLGDMDPVDLMVFAWWREALAPGQVAYLGVSDRYLDRLEIEIPENKMIRLSPYEQQSLGVLKDVCPDYRALVGAGCAALLDAGLKIELEAVATRLGPPGRLLAPAIEEA